MNSRIQSAKFKLSQHRAQGSKSNLSIFQVAQLMDTVQNIVEETSNHKKSIFFSLN